MLDLFLYCDLAATHVSARGQMTEQGVFDLVRVIDRLPGESTVVVDLRDVSAVEGSSLELLRAAIMVRADSRSVFRVIEPDFAQEPPALDAA